MNKALVATACILFHVFASDAGAEKLCLKVGLKKASGKISTQSVIAAACPKGFKELVDTAFFKGDKGDVGAPGMVNLDSCVTETVVATTPCSAGLACTLGVYCGGPGTAQGSEIGDLMIAWSYNIDNLAGYLVSSQFYYPTNQTYPTGVQITTTSESGFGSHVPGIKIVCCLPN